MIFDPGVFSDTSITLTLQKGSFLLITPYNDLEFGTELLQVVFFVEMLFSDRVPLQKLAKLQNLKKNYDPQKLSCLGKYFPCKAWIELKSAAYITFIEFKSYFC